MREISRRSVMMNRIDFYWFWLPSFERSIKGDQETSWTDVLAHGLL
jgi:hypothetical protein